MLVATDVRMWSCRETEVVGRMDLREFGIEGSTEIGFLWVRTIGLRLDIHRGDCRGGDGD